MPWLQKHAPVIDWENFNLKLDSEYCKENCFAKSISSSPSSSRAINIAKVSALEFEKAYNSHDIQACFAIYISDTLTSESSALDMAQDEISGIAMPLREPSGIAMPLREPSVIDMPLREPLGMAMPLREPSGIDMPLRESQNTINGSFDVNFGHYAVNFGHYAVTFGHYAVTFGTQCSSLS
ncbi:hypothetical protein VC83_05446 [Pseudogymnoascus destructans]|uniref:Uncharacterized protein n=1 Tax=Pseudogymnoascus destructans TaxID=655981 RepID=A0A177A7K2_9PEZI|nr:uncharacterized protein VC83_05446 [Pseudogymnoascus destructans]OAF58109.1 hypothetical protein VC83_05446 [Pseudogymnoascus destructans]